MHYYTSDILYNYKSPTVVAYLFHRPWWLKKNYLNSFGIYLVTGGLTTKHKMKTTPNKFCKPFSTHILVYHVCVKVNPIIFPDSRSDSYISSKFTTESRRGTEILLTFVKWGQSCRIKLSPKHNVLQGWV